MADPVKTILRAARQGRSVTLNRQETQLLAAGLVNAARELSKRRPWWRRLFGG